MTTRNYTDERRWACPDLSESRIRIARHHLNAYEDVFGAYTAALAKRDYTTALLLKAHLKCVKDGGSCELCGVRDGERKEAA